MTRQGPGDCQPWSDYRRMPSAKSLQPASCMVAETLVPERAHRRRARCMAAAFPELMYPTTCRSRRLQRLLHRSGENDKRYRRHHPASQRYAGLPVLILINPNNPILQSCEQPDCNCGATLARTGMCVHVLESRKTWLRSALRTCGACRATGMTALSGQSGRRSRRLFAIPLFSIEFAFWRGRWRRPCVKYRFNSYTCRGLTAACRLYIQNEGLRENFWQDKANGLAKRCRSPFIADGSPPRSSRPVCHNRRRRRRTAYR